MLRTVSAQHDEWIRPMNAPLNQEGRSAQCSFKKLLSPPLLLCLLPTEPLSVDQQPRPLRGGEAHRPGRVKWHPSATSPNPPDNCEITAETGWRTSGANRWRTGRTCRASRCLCSSSTTCWRTTAASTAGPPNTSTRSARGSTSATRESVFLLFFFFCGLSPWARRRGDPATPLLCPAQVGRHQVRQVLLWLSQCGLIGTDTADRRFKTTG